MLIVGDPGDPAKGDDLPGARSEALKVKEILDGQPGIVRGREDRRTERPARRRRCRECRPADRLEVLSLLLRGDYDLVHYAGHGDFDPAKPDRVGWVFARGLLTPGEIGAHRTRADHRRLERVPLGPNLAGARRAHARSRRPEPRPGSSRASRTSSSSSASATTSARPGR